MDTLAVESDKNNTTTAEQPVACRGRGQTVPNSASGVGVFSRRGSDSASGGALSRRGSAELVRGDSSGEVKEVTKAMIGNSSRPI